MKWHWHYKEGYNKIFIVNSYALLPGFELDGKLNRSDFWDMLRRKWGKTNISESKWTLTFPLNAVFPVLSISLKNYPKNTASIMEKSTPFIFSGPLLGPSQSYLVLGGRNETFLLDFVQSFLEVFLGHPK